MAIEFSNHAKCTVCGAERCGTNHWFLLATEEREGVRAVAVAEWNKDGAELAEAVACGEGCAHKLFSRWLETRTFEAPNVRSETHELSHDPSSTVPATAGSPAAGAIERTI